MSTLFRLALCAALGSAAFIAQADTKAFETPRLPRTDGGPIHWYLDRPAGSAKVGLLVIAQGSGCQSVTQSENLAAIRLAFPEFATLMVEKHGVTTKDRPEDDHMDCSASFREHHTVSQRLSDYRQVIEGLRGAEWWDGQLALIGGSEGGLAMAMLAPQVQAQAVILLSTGGGLPFGEIVRQSIPEPGRPQADAAFEKARKHPASSELWAGSSLRFWADIIDRRVADDLLRSSADILLIQGGKDVSGSTKAARAASDLFVVAGRCNLTYWELAGLDHGLVDANGNSRMHETLSLASLWLRTKSASAERAQCMKP